MSFGPASEKRYSRGYLSWLLFLMFLVEAVGFMERVIIQTVGQSVKEDLALSDTQLGLLSGISFGLLYATLGLPIARLAERYSRVRILSISVMFFSGMSMLCGAAQNFWHLLGFRLGVGAGEAGLQPSVVSLISDHFSAARRSAALTIAMFGLPFGSLLGALGGGMIAEHLSWRVAFVVVGAPGVIIGCLVWLTLREPPRGFSDGLVQKVSERPPSMLMVLRTLFGTPGFVPVILGVAFVSMGIGIMGTFLHPFLVRHFRVGVGDAAAYFGISSAIAVTIGLAWSGFGTSWLGRRGLHWNCILPSVGVMLATPLYLSSWEADSAFATMVFVTLASLFSISYNTPLLALFQNIVEPRMRATAAAIFFCTGTLIGHGLGPVIFGMFSDTLTQSAFTHGSYDVLCSTRPDLAAPCLDASAAGLRGAGILVGVFTGTASVLFALAAFKFRSISEYTSK